MVAKTVVSETCDSCAVAGRENIKGEEFVIGGMVIGACAKCRKALAPVAGLLEVYGRAPGASANGHVVRPVAPSQMARGGKKVMCSLCKREVAYGSRAYHARHHHSLRMSEVKWLKA